MLVTASVGGAAVADNHGGKEKDNVANQSGYDDQDTPKHRRKHDDAILAAMLRLAMTMMATTKIILIDE